MTLSRGDKITIIAYKAKFRLQPLLPPPMRFFLFILLSSALAFPLKSFVGFSPQQLLHAGDQCPIDIPPTCTNSTPVENSCCFESPGGIILQTQFWDYYPPIGAADEFTLHGLWPDNCDGTYEQFCDATLNIPNGRIHEIIVGKFKDPQLYEEMQKVWKNFNGNDESLWVHEFNKHATCMQTLKPPCYGALFEQDQNVYDYFRIAMNLYKKLPTFEFLAKNGIVPSLNKTYTRDEIALALSEGFGGANVMFKCNRYSAIQEVWYFHHLQGSAITERFIPIPSLLQSNCPAEGIKFLPKGKFKIPDDQPPKDPSGLRGHIKLSGHDGCLISNGQHYSHGTCATFRVRESQFGGRNVFSSKGVCGVDTSGVFNCNRQNKASSSQFQLDKEHNYLGYGGNFLWCLDFEHKHGSNKYQQTPIKLSDGTCDSFRLVVN